MLTERPHYSKSLNVTEDVIKRKVKPRYHSFHLDAKVNLDAVIPSINTAREYNLKVGKRYIDAVMVVFYGQNKDGLARNSSSGLITIGSRNDYIMDQVERALDRLRQSDARAVYMRIVYDINKTAAQERAEKQSARVQTAARNLNVAKSYGFTNYNDYTRALRELNRKYKHGATEAGLKRAAKQLASRKAKEAQAKAKTKVKAKAKVEAKDKVSQSKP